jgi:aryl-alcohol dehydrogenase-like predicted oxidoreductase
VSRIALAPGYEISRVINGGWQLSEGHGADYDPEAVLDGLFQRVSAGLTTFDGADIYTGVEELLGRFLRLYRERTGDRHLEGVQVHTKCVPDRDALPTLRKPQVEAIVDRSLRRLGVERLDLVQFHWWDYAVLDFLEAAYWLVQMQEAGKIRLLGATNFDTPHLREMLDAGFPIVTHQVQYSLLDRRPEGAMVDLCRERGVHLLAYGTLAGGFLAGQYRGEPEPEPPWPNRSLAKYHLIVEEFGGWPLFQELLEAVATLAERHGVSPATVAVRAVLDRPRVAAAILGSHGTRHLASTLEVFTLELTPEDRQEIHAVLERAPGPRGEPFALEREAGGRHGALLKMNLNRAVQ